MKNFLIKTFLVILGVSVIILSICVISCQLSPEGIILISGDYSCPKCNSFFLTNTNNAIISFSEEVYIDSLKLVNDSTTTNISCNSSSILSTIDNTSTQTDFSIDFSENTFPEYLYTLSGVATDKKNNSLTFHFTFTGFNNNIPKLVLNEVRTESSKLKYEFIEIVALSEGNLGGVQILCGYDSENGIFTFPSVYVKENEYIVVHYRKSEEGAITEINLVNASYEEELAVSTATDSCSTARDFWIDNTDARIQKSDVILIKDKKDGIILDAVLFSESTNLEWKKDIQKEYATQASENGIWLDNSFENSVLNAAISDGITNTRTLSRQSLQGKSSKDNWKIVATSNATPGTINSSKLYMLQ